MRAHDRGLCACGFHSTLTQDRSNFFTFGEDTCPVCAGIAKYARIQHANDDQAMKAMGENPPPNRTEPGDGRRVFVRRATQSEIAEHQRKRTKGGRRGNS